MATWTGWPKKLAFKFYSRGNELEISSADARRDLADALMLRWPHRQRTVYLEAIWPMRGEWGWDELSKVRIEENIRYDLSEDGYAVRLSRLPRKRSVHPDVMSWKIVILAR